MKAPSGWVFSNSSLETVADPTRRDLEGLLAGLAEREPPVLVAEHSSGDSLEVVASAPGLFHIVRQTSGVVECAVDSPLAYGLVVDALSAIVSGEAGALRWRPLLRLEHQEAEVLQEAAVELASVVEKTVGAEQSEIQAWLLRRLMFDRWGKKPAEDLALYYDIYYIAGRLVLDLLRKPDA